MEDAVFGGGTFSSILDRAIRSKNVSSSNDNSGLSANDVLKEDWTAHHVSYQLLMAALTFFAERRTKIQAFRASRSSKTIREEEFNAVIEKISAHAPFSMDNSNSKLHHWAFGSHKTSSTTSNDAIRTGTVIDGKGCMTSDSPYQRMASDKSNTDNLGLLTAGTLTDMEIVQRISFLERSELAFLLDKEVERAATFYRLRISELAPPREDGGTVPTFSMCGVVTAAGEIGLEKEGFAKTIVDKANCGSIEFLQCLDEGESDVVAGTVARETHATELGNYPIFSIEKSAFDDDFNDFLLPSQEKNSLTFTQMASEILELHAFITINIIVVRQILIRYDAFARSVGGFPMSSWYQTTRRKRGGGRSENYRELVVHSKLQRLSRAYVKEYSRLEEMEIENTWGHGENSSSYDEKKIRKRRFYDLSKAFYKIVDSAEEIKRRQRLKWRQSAIVLADDDKEQYEERERNLDSRECTSDNVNIANNAIPLSPPASMADHYINTPIRMYTPPPPFNPKDSLLTIEAYPDTPLEPYSFGTPPLKPPDKPKMRKQSENTTRVLDIGEDIAYQIHIFKCIQSKTERSIEKTYSGHISGFWDNAIATLRDYFLLGSISDNLSLMPQFLIMRGKSLKMNLLLVAQWREARNAYLYGLLDAPLTYRPEKRVSFEEWFSGFCGESHPDSSFSSSKSQPQHSFKSNLSLGMNILACFFYMMNYYIVEPSSTQYANALGMGDAMSGLIIGAMPWAAIIGAIVYSIWSNRCYRAPMLTSGMLLIIGNLLYASAYRHQSITMALFGRFITGLGGPRCMNRRYIADTTPLAQRTAVNAAFGTATAMGSALGPATAIMIDGIDIQFNIPLYGRVYINGMTGSGYIMCILWTLFTLILALTFEEPIRSGLEEQRNKEMFESPTTSRSEYEMKDMFESNPATKSSWDLSNTNDLKREEQQHRAATYSATPALDAYDCTSDGPGLCIGTDPSDEELSSVHYHNHTSACSQITSVLQNLTLSVRLCMFLLFSKMFTVESVISAASMVTKNRYGWSVQQVGKLGTIVGCLTIPISIFIGWVSQYYEDRVLMIYLMTFAAFGMGLLVDLTDFVTRETETYNEGNPLAVGPNRYIAGYLLVFCSVQAFDGVVGSVLSKVIPTALATGTLNSGLLATIVGTFGRACGDVFIVTCGYIDLRNVMNMLFVPSFFILLMDLCLIWCNYDALTA